ncbi:hypothetical protein GN958_ATG19320, partial [Phytophthora infestans]
ISDRSITPSDGRSDDIDMTEQHSTANLKLSKSLCPMAKEEKELMQNKPGFRYLKETMKWDLRLGGTIFKHTQTKISQNRDDNRYFVAGYLPQFMEVPSRGVARQKERPSSPPLSPRPPPVRVIPQCLLPNTHKAIAWCTMCTELKKSDNPIIIQCLKLRKCRYTPCKQASPYATCSWRKQLLVSLDRNVVSLFDFCELLIKVLLPQSRPQKDFAKPMARAGMKPARTMLLHIRLRPSELPYLQTVENVACYYRHSELGGVVTQLLSSWRLSISWLSMARRKNLSHSHLTGTWLD